MTASGLIVSTRQIDWKAVKEQCDPLLEYEAALEEAVWALEDHVQDPAKATHHVSMAVLMVPKSDRLDWLTDLNAAHPLPPAVYTPLLADIWTSVEKPSWEAQEWREAWASALLRPVVTNSEADLASFNAMPDPLVSYRGIGWQAGRDVNIEGEVQQEMRAGTFGLSWTIDRAKADWFAERSLEFLRARAEPQPAGAYVLTGVVSKRSVLAYLTERNESEIVVLPEHVRVQEIERVRHEPLDPARTNNEPAA